MPDKIITDGIYCIDDKKNRPFKVQICAWKNPKTGKVENIALVPLWVNEELEKWTLIKKKYQIEKKDKKTLQLTLLK